jgi:uncharacterized protein (DUF885 family)
MKTELDITKEELLDLAATKLADQENDYDEITARAEKLIKERVEEAFRNRADAVINSVIEAEVTRLLSTEYVPVDMWGEKVGTPTTIRDQLTEQAKKFWTEKVDERGKKTTYYGGEERHQWLLKKVVQDEFTKTIKDNISSVVAGLKAALKEHGQKVVAQHIEGLIK